MREITLREGEKIMAKKVSINALAGAVSDILKEYSQVTSEDVKKAVKSTAQSVKKNIAASAPKKSGAYASSWSVKNTKETSESLLLTVHSKNRYQLAHLLEFGHAKRGGGRTAGKSHIAPAEQAGIKELEEKIERSLKHG